MAEYRDCSAIIAEALPQIASERIRAAAQFAIGQRSIVADMCGRFRSRYAPAIDSFDQIHSETLINKRRRRKIAAAIDRDQRQNNCQVINNEQYAMQCRMLLEPAHMLMRCLRLAMRSRGVRQLSRSNSAGETLMPNCSSIIKISWTVRIESRTWYS